MHDNAGSAALVGGWAEAVVSEALPAAGPKPRKLAAAAMPRASTVMITVTVPFARDLSGRNSIVMRMIPNNPAAANVSHIGKTGERQNWSSDVAQAQFMRDAPQRSIERIQRN